MKTRKEGQGYKPLLFHHIFSVSPRLRVSLFCKG